ncbi:hypothetical protein [Okeania sp.]|uniref:hypothetical protein n=1 Tax=Okeania sp. TaxID=3100323 RepID=UPI002B4AD306|nr:hypothetical protein [Okeania sp.]MEB3340192.1 hypothetical protein [Okeania sp.]
MTGFIRGLFGKKDDNQPKEAFFLDSDSASSMGNVDFMRKSKTVKRSYPKAAGKLNVIEGETEKSVSSTQKRESGAETQTSSSSSTSSFTQSSTFQPTKIKPRTVSNSNDGIDFKNMARDIKKKR